jgi:molecular chaperone GrpE
MDKEDNIPKPEEPEPLDAHESDSQSTEEEKEESVGRLKSKLDDAYGKQDDLKGKYMRAVADLENLRKRSIRDREEAVQRTRSQIISDLLPVMDAFQLGFVEAKKHEQTANLVEGFSMAMTQMETTLSEYGLKVIDPTGEVFDAKLHEAIGYEESDDCEEGHVITTVRTGYRISERLLRPASVILAKPLSVNDKED